MKKIQIFDPAMCCSTGVCGPAIDPELLRISTAISSMEKHGIKVERYGLSDNPQIFIDNKAINDILSKEGAEALPVTMIDGVVVKKTNYPTNEELAKLLEVPESYLGPAAKVRIKGCGCGGGCC